MSLPAIPGRVWLAGIAALLLVAGIRMVRSRRVLRRGRAAPPSVERLVARAARDLGLRRPPVTRMVDFPIPPMLWCGRQVRLVLPRPLWAQLDEIGRRAVICHELAHLRRRDHWVCRAEMIIGWLYWWNPVVWWVRRHVRDEADLSCDAWVTALIPEGRRAYAQALLEARQCSHVELSAAPSVGLGATTRRARRFARRLTMVMTAQNSPRLSRKGFALAGVLMLGGLLVTPIWACPDDDKEPCKTAKQEKAKQAETTFKVIVPAQPPCAPEPPCPPKAPTAQPTTFESFMYQQGQDDDLERRISKLEQKLDKLSEQLKKIVGKMSEAGVQGPMPAPQPKVRAYAGPENPPEAPGADRIVIRTYKLPKGKLKALTALMIREDVPIMVRPGDAEIEVHATPENQMIFEAFCEMLNGEEKVVGYTLSEGKLQALNELMVRSDVPILVEPGSEDIKVHGTDLEQLVFKAFVNMIDPSGAGAMAPRADRGDAAQAYARALADLAYQYETSAASQMAQLEGLRAALKSLQKQADAVQRQADKLDAEADKYWDKAEQLEDKAEQLRQKADEVQGARRNEMLVKAEALVKQAEALRTQAQQLEAQAAELEVQAEGLQGRADEVQEQIEELQESEGEH
jgi:beta-lactamase regulating signal transducer with metallopeptidase domain/prefoldin subunit 5